jgi:hypothetical protein
LNLWILRDQGPEAAVKRLVSVTKRYQAPFWHAAHFKKVLDTFLGVAEGIETRDFIRE